MKKAMQEICVSITDNGEIEMQQSDMFEHQTHSITVYSEQVDLLVEWLLEAKKKIEEGL